MIFTTDTTDANGITGTISLEDTYSSLVNTMATTRTTGTTGTSPSNSTYWESASPSTLKFQIEDEEIVFEEQEIIYLKEMLTEWVLENRPESLL